VDQPHLRVIALYPGFDVGASPKFFGLVLRPRKAGRIAETLQPAQSASKRKRVCLLSFTAYLALESVTLVSFVGTLMQRTTGRGTAA